MRQSDSENSLFRVEEATIDELHRAIKSGRTTCVEVVRQYIDRVRAFYGVCSMLVTENGAPVPKAMGATRAMETIGVPTETRQRGLIQRQSNDTLANVWYRSYQR